MQRDTGVVEALARPKVRPHDRAFVKLRAESDRLKVELAKACTLVEEKEGSARCWISSPPVARSLAEAGQDDDGNRGAHRRPRRDRRPA